MVGLASGPPLPRRQWEGTRALFPIKRPSRCNTPSRYQNATLRGVIVSVRAQGNEPTIASPQPVPNATHSHAPTFPCPVDEGPLAAAPQGVALGAPTSDRAGSSGPEAGRAPGDPIVRTKSGSLIGILLPTVITCPIINR